MLPSTEDLLNTPAARELLAETGRRRLTSLSRAAIDSIRHEISTGTRSEPRSYSKVDLLAKAEIQLKLLWASSRALRLRRVINATGVVIHTNLGRAPLSAEALQVVQEASGYCTVEYDIRSGKRGKRGAYVEDLISEITEAESALVVNNCAAAAFLLLVVLANGGEVIVSRGELVEIGGDFRVPDVLAQSGARLKEVGTTNRTKLSDYEQAISENTKAILRVHPSNYKIVGFTEKPSVVDLAGLSRRHGIVLYEDAGSGALVDLSQFGLDEPRIASSISDGADVVSFSGDKLLGGAQAGIIVGRKGLVEQIRKHPLYRALRASKLVYAILEATLESYLREDAMQQVPVLKMLAMSKEEITARAESVKERLLETLDAKGAGDVEIVAGESVIGGGAASGVQRETALIALKHSQKSAVEIEEGLRTAETPVISRIENDKVMIDLRTVSEDDEPELLEVISNVLR